MFDGKSEPWTQLDQRQKLFEAAISKMFSAYNKSITGAVIGAKAEMLAEMLPALRTEKITDFFTAVRHEEENLPSDPKILRIFRARYAEFGSTGAEQGEFGRHLSKDEATEIGARLVAKFPEHAAEIRAVVGEAYRDQNQIPGREFMERFNGLLKKMLNGRSAG